MEITHEQIWVQHNQDWIIIFNQWTTIHDICLFTSRSTLIEWGRTWEDYDIKSRDYKLYVLIQYHANRDWSNFIAALRVLALGRNNIKKIEGLEVLADTLEELWLSYNLIEKVNGVECCKKLKVLYLSQNKIKDWGSLDKVVKIFMMVWSDRFNSKCCYSRKTSLSSKIFCSSATPSKRSVLPKELGVPKWRNVSFKSSALTVKLSFVTSPKKKRNEKVRCDLIEIVVCVSCYILLFQDLRSLIELSQGTLKIWSQNLREKSQLKHLDLMSSNFISQTLFCLYYHSLSSHSDVCYIFQQIISRIVKPPQQCLYQPRK